MSKTIKEEAGWPDVQRADAGKRPGEKRDEHRHLTTRAQSQEGPSERSTMECVQCGALCQEKPWKDEPPEALKVRLAMQSAAEESRPKGAGLAEAVGGCFPSPALVPSQDARLVPVYWSVH